MSGDRVTPPPAPTTPGTVQPVPQHVQIVYVYEERLSGPRKRALIRKYGRRRLENAGRI